MEAGEYSYFTGLPCKRGHVAARRTHNSSCLECYPGKQRAPQLVLDRKSNSLARRKAKEARENFYFGAPCKYGHAGKRLTSNGSCCECSQLWDKQDRRNNPAKRAKRSAEWKANNSEKDREHKSRTYFKNKEKHLPAKQAYYRANAPKLILYSKNWQRANPQVVIDRNRLYGQNNKERDREKKSDASTRWLHKNPDKVQEYRNNRLARKFAAEGRYSTDDLAFLCEWQENSCNYCSRHIENKYSIDHIVALINGGSNWPENIQLLCKSCNSKKGAADPFVFLLKFSEAVQERWLLRLLLRQDLLIKALSETSGAKVGRLRLPSFVIGT